MKIALLFAVAVVIFSSVPGMAHQAASSAQQSGTASAAGAQVNESGSASAQTGPGQTQANGSAAAGARMQPVKGELVGKLDSKSARVGQQVVVKTNEKMSTVDGTVIPKGSRLIGHVTQVQAHESSHQDSSMGIEFDQAEIKNGQNVAIHSVIESIAPPANAAAAASMDNDDSFGAPVGGGRAGSGAMGGGGMGGGRSGGGLVGGTVGSATSATGNMGSGLGSTTRSAVGATGDLAGDATARVGDNVRGAATTTESLGAHATAIPGVMLAGDASGSASGMLSAANKNIHLDSGTQMVLGVSAVASKE